MPLCRIASLEFVFILDYSQITLNDLGAELFLAIEELVRTALAEINQAQVQRSIISS